MGSNGDYDANTISHQNVSIDDTDSKLHTQIREIITAAADTIDLNEAEAIVAAGRGVKDEAAKALIDELADVLNAGIGASRALTEAGVYDRRTDWADREGSFTAVVYRGGDLRGHSTRGGHHQFESDRGGEQRRRCAHFRGGRLRHRGGFVRGITGPHR